MWKLLKSPVSPSSTACSLISPFPKWQTFLKTLLLSSTLPSPLCLPQAIFLGFPFMPSHWTSQSQQRMCVECPLCSTWCNWQLSPVHTSLSVPCLISHEPKLLWVDSHFMAHGLSASLLALCSFFSHFYVERCSNPKGFVLKSPFLLLLCAKWKLIYFKSHESWMSFIIVLIDIIA